MSYLLLPRLRIRAANALAGNVAITPAQLMACVLFGHNLGLKTGCRPQRVAIVHHDAQLLGEYGSDGFYDFHPQQRRGATFIDNVDYSSKNPHALSLQPTASCHLTLSLLFEVQGSINVQRIESFLRTARIAGGNIDSHGKIEAENDLDDLHLPKGFWLIERSDLLQSEGSPVDALVAAIGRRPAKTETTGAQAGDVPPPLPESWLAASVLGYAMTTPFETRAGARQTDRGETPLHAFCEPLLGLVQYVSTRDYGQRPIPWWEHSWLQDDVFVIRQSQAVPQTISPSISSL
ncbi:type I-F CRISPR-associated protein Csy2 [Rhodocyclus tenuis]|uniref:CRISPR-associated protein Csy2 n=1 Tax=Rhodocyclus tenuis TaxID=1066 RepID=A0A840GDE3_RHOTE|nr:type I-F CRISPR-associated protein Csy2 [Rhodocyclus tenuis]MBB4246572.1 CRISPR-associated protein Csy2 [Rhodocyclus tenuis]